MSKESRRFHKSEKEMYKKSVRVKPIVINNPESWKETKTSSKITMYINVKAPLLHLYVLTSVFYFFYPIES